MTSKAPVATHSAPSCSKERELCAQNIFCFEGAMGFCGHFILAQGYTSRALKAETLWCDELM